MDNLTHSLVGLVAAKAGLERVSPYATVVCIVAANLPDADLITLVGGQWTYLEQHRGISHSLVGALVLAVALPLIVYGGERLLAYLRRRPPRARLGGLMFASFVLTASHPLLDWTNSYGVRPLLPWSGRWFYGDLVFILDPWLWLSLGGTAFLLTAAGKRWRVVAWSLLALVLTAVILVLPALWGLPYPLVSLLLWVAGLAGIYVAHRARLAQRWGSALAGVALALVVVYWGALALLHARALAETRTHAERQAVQTGETLERVAALPLLADPTRWMSITETNRATTRFEVSLTDNETTAPRVERFEKPQGAAAQLVARAASEDSRARIFLDFSRFTAVGFERNCAAQTLVQFADLRFAAPGDRRGNFTLETPVADDE